MNMEVSKWAGDVMVTNHLQAPYSVYFTQNHTIVRRPGRRQEESYDCTAPRPAAGRIIRFFINFLRSVRCPLKFRFYLKFNIKNTTLNFCLGPLWQTIFYYWSVLTENLGLFYQKWGRFGLGPFLLATMEPMLGISLCSLCFIKLQFIADAWIYLR